MIPGQWKFDSRKRRYARYFGPTLLVILALLIQSYLRPLVGGKAFILLYPSLSFGCMFGGFFPGVVATGIAAIGGWYYFLPHLYSFSFSGPGDVFGLMVFTATGFFFSFVGGRLRSARMKERRALNESEEAGRKLQAAEQKFRGLIESAPDALVIVNNKGAIELVNRQAVNWFGYQPSEIVGQPIEILIPERYRQKHVGQREGFTAHPHARPMGAGLDLFACRKDGSEFPVDISLSPMKSNGTTVITAAVRDVTEKKKLQTEQKFHIALSKALAESIDYRANIIKVTHLAVPDFADWCLVYGLDRDGRPRLQSVAHRDQQKVALLDGLVREYAVTPEFPPGVTKAIASGQPAVIPEISEAMLLEAVSSEESRELYRELGIRSYLVVPMVGHSKTLGGMLFCYGDSGRQFKESDLPFYEEVARSAALAIGKANLYREAQEAIRVREDVLAIVSHDLKNPVSAILLSAQVLSRLLPPDEWTRAQIGKVAEGIEKSAHMMQKLITSILDFAKIQAGTFTIEPKEEDVGPMLDYFIHSVRPLAAARSIEVVSEVQADLPRVLCERGRIDQVLSNLVGNAIKFCSEGDTITVRANQIDGEVCFSVSDTGPGIDEEHLPHLFERYWQAKSTARMGTGLGLSIAKGIVEAHRGRIWAKSELGQGSTFFFTLPTQVQEKPGLSVARTSEEIAKVGSTRQ